MFAGRGLKGNLPLFVWIGLVSIILLIVLLSPSTFFIGGVLPYRWTLLLVYPLSFFAVEGLSRIKWNWYKVAVGFLLAILSVTFMVLPNGNAFAYYSNYPTYIPKSMLQNTVQLSDCQDTVNALLWAKNNMPANGRLLVHEAFYGWAKLSFDNASLIPYFFSTPEDSISNITKSDDSNSLYLIWWVNGAGWYGQPTVPTSFEELYHSGNIAIYHYTKS